MKTLRISEELCIPAESAVTATLVAYGGKGMGKTNFGSVWVARKGADAYRVRAGKS